VAYPDGTTIAYTYDAAGNRLTQVISNPAIPLPSLTVDKTLLTFNAYVGQSNPPSQSVSVSNGGGGTLNWLANPTDSWVKINPAAGTNNGSISVSPTIGSFGVGTFTSTVSLSSPGSANTPQLVTVKLVMAACGWALTAAGTTATATGGSGSVGLVAPSACSAPVQSNVSWITVNSGPSVAGGGAISYTVSENAGSQRTGGISIADQTFTIVQTGSSSPCDLDRSGTIDVSDVQMIINEALGLLPPADDLYSDGVVDVADVQIVINGALHLGCTVATAPVSAANSRNLKSKSEPLDSVVTPVRENLSVGSGNFLAVGTSGLLANAIDLGTLGGVSASAYGINNLGEIVGGSSTGQSKKGDGACVDRDCPVIHAFEWEAGRMEDLGRSFNEADANSFALGINDGGAIVGVYSRPDGGGTLFLYAGGLTRALKNVAYDGRSAINNLGEVVGSALKEGALPPPEAFIWSSGTVTNLGALGGTASQASGVNDSGQVAGFAYLGGNSAAHAFLYGGTGLTDLGTLGGTNSVALAVNNAGQVVGSSQTTGDRSRHAFLYSGGTMTDLGTLGGIDSQASGINSNGLIVGWAKTVNGEQHAVLWTYGSMVDLNSIVTLGPDVTLAEAVAVNEVGQVIANGNNGRAYLITLPAQLR
jgi:probable HAF family extracellular repeat protein